ncbi:hypothetical protein BHE74_00053599 [Ensete ventricosum]|nr:hypothetical protein BHE74_00053599 [Ensete ventricosum]
MWLGFLATWGGFYYGQELVALGHASLDQTKSNKPCSRPRLQEAFGLTVCQQHLVPLSLLFMSTILTSKDLSIAPLHSEKSEHRRRYHIFFVVLLQQGEGGRLIRGGREEHRKGRPKV